MLEIRFSLFVIVLSVIRLIYGNLYDDYCWKDYNGTKPSNALNAGLDKNGRIINVGQVLFQDMLMCGEIYENQPYILYELGGVRNATEHIRVLCSDHPEKFEWYPVHFEQVQNITNKVFFDKGAVQATFDVYVGRKYVDGELRVGKLVCVTSCDTFRLAHFNGSTTYHEEFEILTYNENV